MSNPERKAVEAELGRLTSEFFRAVSFEPGGSPSYASIPALFIERGLLIKNVASTPEISSVQEFIEPREALVASGTLTRFHESEISQTTVVFMERLAKSWGDQPYGAVLVGGAAIIGHGPSRVVKLGDPTAHAEREAIRDAQQRLGRTGLAGSVLYSTSRPCRMCEAAAADANVTRMTYGADLSDAGAPKH